MEVETPVLQPLYGGAAATPFVTHYAHIDSDIYLRISDELYLKRLIVGGFERVYEIAKDFRNEGVSRKHSPEFTMLELYQAYADYSDIMDLFETMVSQVAHHVLGTLRINYQGDEISLTPPWRRITVRDAILEWTGLDIDLYPESDSLRAALFGLRDPVSVGSEATRGKMVDEIFAERVEPHFIQPTILYDHPVDFPGGLLAKRSKSNPNITERFEVFIGGMEIANAFTELNEPHDQQARMEEAFKLVGDEHQQIDRDYLLALEHGMPPTGGLGFGIDRLVMILADAGHIRETILFPLLRPKEDGHVEP
jgi:lysyl-tRNA synthetase class 2